ncbi:hypothetical protein C8R46DRAFT_1194197 [Mycena filopes]|nr:hypothetical protein C8R46DRAFT_1194197 [Mycena filopes]
MQRTATLRTRLLTANESMMAALEGAHLRTRDVGSWLGKGYKALVPHVRPGSSAQKPPQRGPSLRPARLSVTVLVLSAALTGGVARNDCGALLAGRARPLLFMLRAALLSAPSRLARGFAGPRSPCTLIHLRYLVYLSGEHRRRLQSLDDVVRVVMCTSCTSFQVQYTLVLPSPRFSVTGRSDTLRYADPSTKQGNPVIKGKIFLEFECVAAAWSLGVEISPFSLAWTDSPLDVRRKVEGHTEGVQRTFGWIRCGKSSSDIFQVDCGEDLVVTKLFEDMRRGKVGGKKPCEAGFESENLRLSLNKNGFQEPQSVRAARKKSALDLA